MALLSQPIELVLSDVDGVLTDGGMYYNDDGVETKRFSVYDGMAFKILQQQGLKVGIVTSEDRELNRWRAKKLGLDFDLHGIKDKRTAVEDICRMMGTTLSRVAYIGDDVNCVPLLEAVGVAGCPANAVTRVKRIPGIWLMNRSGGSGAFREFTARLFPDLEDLQLE